MITTKTVNYLCLKRGRFGERFEYRGRFYVLRGLDPYVNDYGRSCTAPKAQGPATTTRRAQP